MIMTLIITTLYVFWYGGNLLLQEDVTDTAQLVLNEQYMVAAHDPAAAKELETKPLMNRVLKVLGDHGQAYKTFGENIIYLLNREGMVY